MICKATFETEFGKIECVRTGSDTGDSRDGIAYFFRQDYETTIARDGRFRDIDGREYRIYWPREWGVPKGTEASLDVVMPRTLGRATVERPATQEGA